MITNLICFSVDLNETVEIRSILACSDHKFDYDVLL